MSNGIITGIKNYALTSSWQEITIDEDLVFNKITIVTSDGSEAQIRYDDTGDEYFPLSSDLDTSPIIIDVYRKSSGYPTRLFDAKGTATLCIMFWDNKDY